MMLSPSRPVLLEPSPWRPRSALYSGLKRKCTSVLWRSLDSMITSPPLPPSPPEGPPRGTNFSLRKATQPLPPSPALTRIFASSMNIASLRPQQQYGNAQIVLHATGGGAEQEIAQKLVAVCAHCYQVARLLCRALYDLARRLAESQLCCRRYSSSFE